MRSFLLIAAAALSFSATMTFETTEANAVVCARGDREACEQTAETNQTDFRDPWRVHVAHPNPF